MSTEVKVLYRYNVMLFFEGRPKVLLSEYLVTKETECGWWIGGNKPKFEPHSFHTYTSKKWVSKTTRKRFAYPTKEEALVNFKARKQRQILIIKGQLERAKEALLIIENTDWLWKQK